MKDAKDAKGTNATMITDTQYQELKARSDKYNAWVDSIRTRTKCRKCKGTGVFRAYYRVSTVDQTCPKCEGRGYMLGWAKYTDSDRPADVPDVTNAERSLIEVYEFRRDKPRKYTAYIRHACVHGVGEYDKCPQCPDNVRGVRKVTGVEVHRPSQLSPRWVVTFTGDVLGVITWYGPHYNVGGFGAHGSTRQNLRVRGVNGITYSAVWYVSSGDYCRMKAFKETNETTNETNVNNSTNEVRA